MGRSYVRWWEDSFKGRPTVTQVNRISEMAESRGYVVISIDARYHGKRKISDMPLRSIMNDMHLFGDKTSYEAMIKDTVIDHRVLLDWVSTQARLDGDNVHVAGYSVGGQIALLLAALDGRVQSVLSIVPPFIDDKVALVAPKNVVSLMRAKSLLLLTADDDENASEAENTYLFSLIETEDKQRIDFEGGHILPEGYVDRISSWF